MCVSGIRFCCFFFIPFFLFFHLFLLINQEQQKQQIKLFNGIDGPISLPPSFSSSIPLHGQGWWWWWLLSKGHHILKQSVRPIEGRMRNRPVLQVPLVVSSSLSFLFFICCIFLLFRMSLGAFIFHFETSLSCSLEAWTWCYSKVTTDIPWQMTDLFFCFVLSFFILLQFSWQSKGTIIRPGIYTRFKRNGRVMFPLNYFDCQKCFFQTSFVLSFLKIKEKEKSCIS